MEVNLVSTTANMEEEVNLEANLEVKVEAASDYILGEIQKLQIAFSNTLCVRFSRLHFLRSILFFIILFVEFHTRGAEKTSIALRNFKF